MKGLIIDSTYKEDIVIGKQTINTIVPCNNLSNNTTNGIGSDLNNISSNYISHTNKNDKYNTYSIVDYL
ncbi:hypothetical protein [Clostridium uliginosum]|uniref:Spore germination protein gerPA/gerPF n=1 Tax=Clostridium uliginosum TaxID=119641 RepID=A0A1I1L3Q5_9CLOT|nr:hypothetical protein [Clostridium uliginosum]SFC67717.1 hypothetical protein SAMN05421842_10762 [Clostridium uliginosum]